jgi:DNA-binding response OmpR family regulator
MPVMNGFELARVIKSLIPSIRVLYMSAAFSESTDLDPRGARIPGSVLRKPFTAGELVSAVEALMESSGPRGTDATRT